MSPMKKKLKKSHPVNVNLEKVEGALYDHHVDVPGTKVTRKMLQMAAPKALGDGAAAEERHGSQKVIVDAIGEILSAEVTKWTEKDAAAQAELQTANVEKASTDATLEAKHKAVDEKKADIDAKHEAEKAAKKALKDAEHALDAATKAVDHHDDYIKKLEGKKIKFETGLNGTLVSLKDCAYANAKEKKSAEGKGVETLRDLLGDAGADDSLTTCFHAALAKEPEKRGTFDTTVIETVEKRLSNHIAKLTAELAEGPATKEKKVATVEEDKAKKEACTAALDAAAEALKKAEAEKPDLDAALKTATHDEKEKAKVVEKITSSKVEPAQEGLATAKENYEAWKYLAERPVEVEEEVPAEVPEEPVEADNA